jgi:hypothetical protein
MFELTIVNDSQSYNIPLVSSEDHVHQCNEKKVFPV